MKRPCSRTAEVGLSSCLSVSQPPNRLKQLPRRSVHVSQLFAACYGTVSISGLCGVPFRWRVFAFNFLRPCLSRVVSVFPVRDIHTQIGVEEPIVTFQDRVTFLSTSRLPFCFVSFLDPSLTHHRGGFALWQFAEQCNSEGISLSIPGHLWQDDGPVVRPILLVSLGDVREFFTVPSRPPDICPSVLRDVKSCRLQAYTNEVYLCPKC